MKKTPTQWRIAETIEFKYNIQLSPHLFSLDNTSFLEYIANSKKLLVFIDTNVFALYGHAIRSFLLHYHNNCVFVRVPSDEQNKETNLLYFILKNIHQFNPPRRQESIIAIGGGVLLDVVGFAASIYRRGISFIRIPTTLIGQVDAGIGVKMGVNYQGQKNRIGTYYHRHSTILDPTFLTTLPVQQMASGMAEILKLAIILDQELFMLIEEQGSELIERRLGYLNPCAQLISAGEKIYIRSIDLMLNQLKPNLLEENLKRSVDFGHTWGPLLELQKNLTLPHGFAVNIDMFLSCCIALNRNLILMSDLQRIMKLMLRLGLPLTDNHLTPELLETGLHNAAHHRGGQLNLPVPTAIGQHQFINNLTVEELNRALNTLEGLINETRYPC